MKERERNLWKSHNEQIVKLETMVGLDSARMLSEFRRAGYDLDEEALPNVLGYEAIEAMLYLIRSALLMKGVYVNYLNQSIEDFAKTYADLPGVDVAEDSYRLWPD